MLDLSAVTFDRSLRVREGQYVKKRTTKSAIVIHHTADGSPRASVDWWNKDPKRIATAYIIDRDGRIYETFDPEYWAYHTGTTTRLDERSIGIELTNWGWLNRSSDGTYRNWRGGVVPAREVVEKRWRGHRYWHAYTEEQMQALIALVDELIELHGIDRDVAPEAREATDFRRWRGFLGVIAHYHVASDKTDVSPAFDWQRLTRAIEAPPEPLPEPLPEPVRTRVPELRPIPHRPPVLAEIGPPTLLDVPLPRPAAASSTPAPMPTMRMPTSTPIRKLRFAGAVGLILAPILSFILARFGLPAVTQEDIDMIWQLLIAVSTGFGSFVTWWTAYRTRPGMGETPVAE